MVSALHCTWYSIRTTFAFAFALQVATSLVQVFLWNMFKAVVNTVGGFWPIGVFFAGYRSFFFVPSRQTQTKARL